MRARLKPRGVKQRWCRSCERMRDHDQAGRCVMADWHTTTGPHLSFLCSRGDHGLCLGCGCRCHEGAA